mmetsp:Transcript_7844/g.15032  ORF Transcript_7844/g.15032 Transcript_7844/m.15032 type:complete len:137 (+) Transcript_7844:8731-9141(+)
MADLSFWLVLSLTSVSVASKDDYFEDGVAEEIKEFVEDFELEGWLVVALLAALVLCCFGKCISCCLGCFHRHDDRRKPLLAPYREGLRPEQTYYLPTLSQNPSYVPPSAPPIYVEVSGSTYPYLPPAAQHPLSHRP